MGTAVQVNCNHELERGFETTTSESQIYFPPPTAMASVLTIRPLEHASVHWQIVRLPVHSDRLHPIDFFLAGRCFMWEGPVAQLGKVVYKGHEFRSLFERSMTQIHSKPS